MLSSERVILANFDDENESEDDLYKGYNDFNPVLDTRNIQEDDLFKETIHKSSYGRPGGLGHRTNTSTAGVAFNRATALKSRRTGRGTGGGGKTGLGSVAGGTAAGNRPLTAVRGAGYTSHGSGGAFDPLGLATSSMAQVGGKASGFHLQDENTPELKIKQLEAQINRLMEESVNAAERKEFGVALDLAKDCVSKERSLNRMKEQSNLMEQFGPNSDLTLAVIFNLAEQYCNSRMWPEAINTYQSILKNRSFTNTGRLRMNIGEIYFRQNQYPKAIKFFRMALDQVPNTQTELRLKLMQNIGLSFVRLTQFADAIASFEYIASERGDLDPQTAFHLIVCYFAMGDNDKMKYYFGKLLGCKVEDQFEERYGHHEILTNGGNIFASSINGHDSPMDLARSTPSGDLMNSSGGMATSVRVSSPVLLIRDEHDHHNNLLIEAIRNDRLRAFEKEKIQHVEWCVLTAAKLIAPYIESSGTTTSGSSEVPAAGGQYDLKAAIDEAMANGSVGAGYDWCLDQIRKMMNAVMTGSVSMNGSGSAGSGSTAICALNFSNMADELELYKAVKHLRAREFDQAIGTLKLFEKKDKLVTSVSSARAEVGGGGHPPLRSVTSASGGFASSPIVNSSSTPTLPNPSTSVTPTHGHRLTTSTSSNSRVAATAATNLSFLYLLQHELDIAGRYADEAIGADRYCTGALLNRGNVYFHQGDYARALDYYRDVINSNPTCLEAYFNLALAERKLGNHDKALESLFRLRTITKMPSNHHTVLNQKISNTIEVNLLYQIASIYESMENIDQATDFYQQVLNMIPTDVSLLVKMADIATDGNDRKQALTYLMEAYRYLPSHIPTIERLAAYYIEVKMYEKAIKYLEQLANNQPNQIKWQLMIAASYRRAGSYQQAFSMYQTIHGRFPDNVDCLKFLIRICAELDAEGRANSTGGGKSYAQLAQQYSDTLKRLEKSRELREQQAIQQQQSNSRSASRASANPGRMGTAQYGRNNGQSASSREGSAATSNSSSGGSISSGYVTSKTPTKSNGTSPSSGRRSGVAPSPVDPTGMPNRSSISAIVDQVVEQLDSTTLNERPTTSWSRRRFKNAVRSASMMASSEDDPQGAGQGNGDYDEDMLLDANLDDILPD